MSEDDKLLLEMILDTGDGKDQVVIDVVEVEKPKGVEIEGQKESE